MIIHYDNELLIVPEPEPLYLELENEAKAEAILILREDFRLTWRAISERMGISEGSIKHILKDL